MVRKNKPPQAPLAHHSRIRWQREQIGNFFKLKALFCIVFACIASVVYASKLTLRVTSLDGQELKHVGMGQAFILEVDAQDIQKDEQSGSLFPARGKAPTIKGIEKFTVRTTGSHMQMINGVGSIRYRYKVIIDRPGGYHIGPALLELNGKQLVSDKIEVTVSDQPVLKYAQKKNDPVLLVASINKNRVMVGESFTYTLRYYFQDRLTRLQSIMPPEFTDFTVTKPRGPVEGREVINGVSYFYGQWEWDITPREKGEHTIAPAIAHVVFENSSIGSMSVLSAFFAGGLDTKQVYSNAVKISVDSLPPYHEPVHAVGQFSHFKARVNQSVVKQGEGLVLTLEVEGDGNIEQLSFPELQNIPDALKFYDSKYYMVDETRGTSLKKRFEYIVQGMDAGMYEIPAQTFTYFDPVAHIYKKLHTVPISIKVKEAVNGKKISTGTLTKQLSKNQKASEKNILQRTESNNIYAKHQWYLSFKKLLLVLVLVMFMGVGFVVGKYTYGTKFRRNSQKEKLFALLRLTVKKIEQTKEYYKLPEIIQTLFVERYAADRMLITQKFMLDKLSACGLSEQELLQFDDFYNQLAALSYGQNAEYLAQEKKSELIVQTYSWISFIENKLC